MECCFEALLAGLWASLPYGTDLLRNAVEKVSSDMHVRCMYILQYSYSCGTCATWLGSRAHLSCHRPRINSIDNSSHTAASGVCHVTERRDHGCARTRRLNLSPCNHVIDHCLYLPGGDETQSTSVFALVQVISDGGGDAAGATASQVGASPPSAGSSELRLSCP